MADAPALHPVAGGRRFQAGGRLEVAQRRLQVARLPVESPAGAVGQRQVRTESDGCFGLAGGVSVSLVDSNTTAYIGSNAHINQPPETNFNPGAIGTVDTFADTIDMGAGHGLVVGNALVYDNGGGQNIGGLVSGNIYFVSSVAGNNIKLATTSGGPAIDLTSAGTGGNHSLVAPGTSNNVSAAENQVLKAFDRWSQDGRISISSIKPQWKRNSDDYMTLECRADAFGSIQALTRFLFEVEKDPLALKVEAIEITARDNDGQQLSLGLQVSGLLLNPQ